MSQTLNTLTEVFRNVFEDDELVITPGTTAKDVEDWDSLMHVNLIITVEKKFDIRFTSAEVASLKDVGELTALIDMKRA